MNGFANHKLDHSSPSQINMWADAPCAWVAKYLHGKRLRFSVAAQVGVLTEQVVADVLCGEEFMAALGRAKDKFNRDNALNPSQKDRERVDDIEAMALQAIDALAPYGEPEFRYGIKGREQQSISLLCNLHDFKLPIVGYLDFVYPHQGLIIDLKTTMRIPSEISHSHARQAAIYSAARGNMECKMLYVSPKKTALHGIEDTAAVLREVKAILTRQERFLRLDKETITACVPVNAGSFYWTGDEAIRRELYGV